MANAVAFELAGSAESAERNRFVMWCEVTRLRVLSEPKVEDIAGSKRIPPALPGRPIGAIGGDDDNKMEGMYAFQ